MPNTKHDYFAGEIGARRLKWIEALESGEYKQGKKQLGDAKTGFCCLGVGCMVLGTAYQPEHDNSGDFADLVGLHTADADIFKIDKEGDYVPAYFYDESSLMIANDDTTAGFKRIGRFIRNNPEKVFKIEGENRRYFR